jgi:hypothetical protein
LVQRNPSITIASFLFIILGLAMAISNPLVLAYIIYNGSAPVVFGIELLDGKSPIGVLWGHDAVFVLGVVLTFVAILGIVAGLWLRRSLRKGGKLGAFILPFYIFFGIGFEIPALYIFVPLTAVLLALGWKSLD